MIFILVNTNRNQAILHKSSMQVHNRILLQNMSSMISGIKASGNLKGGKSIGINSFRSHRLSVQIKLRFLWATFKKFVSDQGVIMQSKFTSANRIVIIFALIMFSFLAINTNAYSCKRKGDFGCCGNGKCNIFCRNCDGGCNKTCEKTSCSDAQWILCSAVCGSCAAACVATDGQACIVCMGPSYESCKGCYVSNSVESVEESASDIRANRDDFFRSIAKIDGDDRSISSKDFAVFMQSEMKRAHTNRTTAPIEVMFKAFDTNGNGVIDRPEIDNDNIRHGLVYN